MLSTHPPAKTSFYSRTQPCLTDDENATVDGHLSPEAFRALDAMYNDIDDVGSEKSGESVQRVEHTPPIAFTVVSNTSTPANDVGTNIRR